MAFPWKIIRKVCVPPMVVFFSWCVALERNLTAWRESNALSFEGQELSIVKLKYLLLKSIFDVLYRRVSKLSGFFESTLTLCFNFSKLFVMCVAFPYEHIPCTQVAYILFFINEIITYKNKYRINIVFDCSSI